MIIIEYPHTYEYIFVRFEMNTDIRVINDNKMEQRTFNSVEEFDLFYQKYKDMFNEKTTNYLNKTYKIITPECEYRITKRTGKDGSSNVFLKKITKQADSDNLVEIQFASIRADINALQSTVDEYTKRITTLENTIGVITTKINQLTSTVNECTDAVNSLLRH